MEDSDVVAGGLERARARRSRTAWSRRTSSRRRAAGRCAGRCRRRRGLLSTMPQIAPAALARMRRDSGFSPAMSTTEYISVTSFTSTYGAVLPDAIVDTITFGTPTGSVRIAAVIIVVPPPPPRPSTPSKRPCAYHAGSSAHAPRCITSTACAAIAAGAQRREVAAAGAGDVVGGDVRRRRPDRRARRGPTSSVRWPRAWISRGRRRTRGPWCRACRAAGWCRGRHDRSDAPGLLGRHVDERRAVEHGGGEDRQEHQRVVAGVVGAVHDVLRDVRDVAGRRGAAISRPTHCSASPEIDVDDLLHRRMAVEGVAGAGRHAHAHEQQIARVGQPGTAQPLVRPPGQLLDLRRPADVTKRRAGMPPGSSATSTLRLDEATRVSQARAYTAHASSDGNGRGAGSSHAGRVGSAASISIDGMRGTGRDRRTAAAIANGRRCDDRCVCARRQSCPAVLGDLPRADPHRRVVRASSATSSAPLKQEFILTNYQVGLIGGAALWGMAISLLVLGPMLEAFGLKNGARFGVRRRT